MQDSNLPEKLIIYFDGLTEPKNPGGWSTCGWLICDESLVVLQCGHSVAAKPGDRHSTNNFAEYCALGFALNWLVKSGWKGKELEIFGDSKLVICQLTDQWACNKEHLQKLRARCLDLLKTLGVNWKASWVPREENQKADELSQQAYQEATGELPPVRPVKVKK